MAQADASQPEIIVVPASTLPQQKWWKALHSTINTSFKNKDISAYPPSWTRLPPESRTAAFKLVDELGPQGLLAVVLVQDHPIACGGVLPYRGDDWIEQEKSADEEGLGAMDRRSIETADGSEDGPLTIEKDWELCYVCVHPLHRRTGVSARLLQAIEDEVTQKGAQRLFSTYVIEETGMYWPRIGYQTIPGAGGVLKKGFTHTKGMPGLREDIHFATGYKTL